MSKRPAERFRACQVHGLGAARRRALAGSGLALLAAFGAGAAHAQTALPTGGTVASGSATIAPGASAVTVTQTTGKAIVNWNSFDVGTANSVTFVQPDANSATLNRVTGTTSSTIAGKISANGAVYLVNPNGIVITSTGAVQAAGGFVASTLDIADSDFSAGNLKFKGKGASAGVSNAGQITAGQGAYVALLGSSVSNSGTISVVLGKVGLGSGEQIVLDLNGDSFMQVAVPTSAITGGNAALIDMTGTIAASGGRVQLSAATVKDAVRNVINMPGGISADSAAGDGGTIILLGGDGGTVTARGTLTARATGTTGNGGFVETSGATVDFNGLKVDTRAANGAAGTWLVDPSDLTIDASAAATISSNLATGNVTLQTNVDGTTSGPGNISSGNGDITIASAISWSANTALTIIAYNDMNLNAAITGANGTLNLGAGNGQPGSGTISDTDAINIGLFNLTSGSWIQASATLPSFSATDFRITPASANFLRVTGGDGSSGTPYLVTDVFGLQGIGSGRYLANNFTLANDIDASTATAWNGGAGLTPIGTNGTGSAWNGTSFAGSSGGVGFSGTFDGAGHMISNLTITRPAVLQYTALFGYASGTIRNLTLTGSVTGVTSLGSVVGYGAPNIVLSNVHSSASVTSITGPTNNIGGLAGYFAGTMSNSSATGNVSGTNQVGGLVGFLANSAGGISNSFATGNVKGNGGYVGGLVGNASGAPVSSSFATGNVNNTTSSTAFTGGLVGAVLNGSQITQSYATGAVSGGTGSTSATGGLIGNISVGSVTQSYATGAVSGSGYVGGLIGGGASAGPAVSISYVYASGSVTDNGSLGRAGGLIGNLTATITLSNAWASGRVIATNGAQPGGIAGNNSGKIASSVYWDSYSTGLGGPGLGMGSSAASAVTSDPASASSSNNAFKTSAYGNFTTGNWVFFNGQTRPFGAWEVPASGAAIINSHQLQLIGANAAALSGSYTLGANINLAETGRVIVGTPGSYAGMWASTGFVPLGTDGAGNAWDGASFRPIANITSGTYGFTGTLNGSGAMLSNLYINRPTIKNVGLFGVSAGTLSGIAVAGTVTGSNGVGGLVGALRQNGSITGSSSAVIASGVNLVGGLVGNQSDATTISGSFATGKVSGTDDIGGLVGYSSGGTIARSYATGQVSGSHYIGGLVGYQYLGGISDSYATGAVSASIHSAGGLIGKAESTSVANTYSTGAVSGPGANGGLIGQAIYGTVTSSFWDTQTSGQATSAGGTGLTTAQMQDPATYVGWDDATTWSITSSNYPHLRTAP